MLAFASNSQIPRATNIVQSRTMLRRLDDLDRSVVADDRRVVDRQRHLWEAYATGEGIVRWPHYLEDGLHYHIVVGWNRIVAKVDVHERVRVPAEPSGLDSYSAACHRP